MFLLCNSQVMYDSVRKLEHYVLSHSVHFHVETQASYKKFTGKPMQKFTSIQSKCIVISLKLAMILKNFLQFQINCSALQMSKTQHFNRHCILTYVSEHDEEDQRPSGFTVQFCKAVSSSRYIILLKPQQKQFFPTFHCKNKYSSLHNTSNSSHFFLLKLSQNLLSIIIAVGDSHYL